jgi:hypothetical protein
VEAWTVSDLSMYQVHTGQETNKQHFPLPIPGYIYSQTQPPQHYKEQITKSREYRWATKSKGSCKSLHFMCQSACSPMLNLDASWSILKLLACRMSSSSSGGTVLYCTVSKYVIPAKSGTLFICCCASWQWLVTT